MFSLTWKVLMVVNDMSARIDDLEKSLEKALAQDEHTETEKQ